MAYQSTSDERYFNGLEYDVGYWDAPDFSASNTYVLAEGFSNAGYGFSEDLLDYDFYDLGYLQPGRYTVVVESYNWDFNNSSSLITPDLKLYENGLNTFELDIGGRIDFIVESEERYSIRVDGWSSSGTEYRVYYTYDGPVEGQNNPAVFSNPTYWATNGLNDNSVVSVDLQIFDLDGLSDSFFLTYWYLDGENFSNTSNAQIEISQEEVGGALAFRVGFEDDLGNFELSPLYLIGDIENVNDVPEGDILISGTPALDEILTIDTSSLHDEDGLGELSYQWLRNGQDIVGETDVIYQVSGEDLGKTLSVRTMYIDGYGTEEQVVSNGVEVNDNSNAGPQGNLVVSGDAVLSELLTVETQGITDEDGLGPFSYQWLRGDLPIAGATSSSYSVVNSDLNSSVSVEVSYTDGAGNSESLVSAARFPVAGNSREYVDLIQMYIVIPNRAPDGGGLEFWSGILDDGETFESIASQMWNSPATQVLYPPEMSTEDKVGAIYNNVLNREPDQEGLDYWAGQWEGIGPVETMLEMIKAITNYSGTNQEAIEAKQLFMNKVDVGAYLAINHDSDDLGLGADAYAYLSDGNSVEDTINYIDQQLEAIGQSSFETGDDMFIS